MMVELIAEVFATEIGAGTRMTAGTEVSWLFTEEKVLSVSHIAFGRQGFTFVFDVN